MRERGEAELSEGDEAIAGKAEGEAKAMAKCVLICCCPRTNPLDSPL